MSKVFRCQKCYEEYVFWNGIGFMFPVTYNKLFTAALNGEYGERLKELLLKNPNAAIDAATSLYICEGCGHWIVTPVLDCYLPTHEVCEEKGKRIWSVAMPIELNKLERRVVAPWELRKGYELLERYKHVCSRCESEMKMRQLDPFGLDAVQEDFSDLVLRCPKCGGDIVDTGKKIMVD